MSLYAGASATSNLYSVYDDSQQRYAVLVINNPPLERQPHIVLFAQIEDRQYIVIEHDATDKPLVEALTAAGVPRDHIVLAYAGETRPDAEQLAANWPPTPD